MTWCYAVQTYVFFIFYFISNTNTHIIKTKYTAGIRDMDGSEGDSLSYSESEEDEYNNNGNGGNDREKVINRW